MHVVLFCALSLDGCLAREDGSLDWLPQEPDPADDLGFSDLLASVDGLLMGRRTFETVLGFGAWPYGSLPCVVVSSTLRREALPEWVPATVDILAGGARDLLAELDARGWRSVYADGGQVARDLLEADRVDEMVLTHVPVLIGQGRRLFGSLPSDLPFEHVHTRTGPQGLVQSRYRRRR